ncbi:MAG: iron-sulfur cluster carrier protein ApbC [Thiotrichales bacterium]|jgi:ATP-binding protein involved in chromosome partitioning|nr:iron-sulfur cluster carrier protein ApbC [Thiotrichales bacterium]MBT3613484.1 iron-sulfur cluster carrier protein ApbC [Thiotrichales bacterium]MBT3753047.1 iron-sulfur cluster carrier protein ApbC [Thiotrichales bacterium]MBT3837330.1 iron-sulfur cluster carrier protein ApbC [Thiotrichales bacterium]MBT4151646.1 iron-sulfur cluster carrier protein ApbC [Thiotrichales bacterium]
MSELNNDVVEAALKTYEDPYLETDLVSAKSINNIAIDGGAVTVDVVLGFPAQGYSEELSSALSEKIDAVDGVTSSTVNVSWDIVSHAVQKGVPAVKGVKNIIAVASGKGGVGKSTTAVNLALALSAEGAKVGILDADIYGPSQPRMLGASGAKPESPDGKQLKPVSSYSLQSMSIGYLVEEDTAMIWRGPMVTQALEQLLQETMWEDLDYLVIDLPPGTGDTQLTLAQKIPVSGALIVTTPQDIALLDAVKGLKMFEKVEVPVLGVVENMSIHICSNCGHEEHIFAEGGGQRMADDANVDFLGSLPLDKQIRSDTDEGKPTVVADPEGAIAKIYRDIARRTSAKLAQQRKEFTTKFPNIVIK